MCVSLPRYYHLYHSPQGIACDLDSEGFQRLDEATRDVMGESKPFSICGSLPLVGDLQKAGFDVQVQPLPMVLVLEEGEQCH